MLLLSTALDKKIFPLSMLRIQLKQALVVVSNLTFITSKQMLYALD